MNFGTVYLYKSSALWLVIVEAEKKFAQRRHFRYETIRSPRFPHLSLESTEAYFGEMNRDTISVQFNGEMDTRYCYWRHMSWHRAVTLLRLCCGMMTDEGFTPGHHVERQIGLVLLSTSLNRAARPLITEVSRTNWSYLSFLIIPLTSTVEYQRTNGQQQFY